MRMLSTQQQQYLCNGYIRNNYIHTTPIEINHIIQAFWNEQCWTFTDKELETFLSADVKHKFTKNIEIGEISCRLVIAPNGDIINNIGYVLFGVSVQLPYNIKSVLMNSELYCPQTGVYWRAMSNGSFGWKYQMTHDQCMNENRLDFMYCINILSVEYDKYIKYISAEKQKINFHRQITMSSKTEYEWNIDHMTVEAFKKYHKGRCEFSPLFDNCWLLWCTPNTWDNDGMFVTGLRLFAI
eukprot:356991_1